MRTLASFVAARLSRWPRRLEGGRGVTGDDG